MREEEEERQIDKEREIEKNQKKREREGEREKEIEREICYEDLLDFFNVERPRFKKMDSKLKRACGLEVLA